MKESRPVIALELTEIGDTVGLILPKELLARFKLEKGNTVFVTEVAQGALMLTPYDMDFKMQMNAARRLMGERRQVLRELAK